MDFHLLCVLAPTDYRNIVALADALIEKKAYPQADSILDIGLAKDSLNLSMLLAICLGKAISQTAEWYHNDLAGNYEELKNYKAAIAHYDTAYYLFKDPIMLYNCGRISESLLKNTTMARKYYRLYLSTAHPQSPEEKKAYNYVRRRWGK